MVRRPKALVIMSNGATSCFFFLLEGIDWPLTGWRTFPTSALCNLAKLYELFGYWNVRGINGIAKREEVVDVFREGKFKLTAFAETKMKGYGDVSRFGAGVISVNVQRIGGVMESAAVLENDVWHS